MSITIDSLADEALPRREFRLAFFDIDNTLLGRSLRPGESLRREIARIQAQGVQTAIASGRPYFAAREVIETLGLWGAGCFYTGGALIDPRSGELLQGRPLAEQDVLALIGHALRENIYIELYTLDAYYVPALTAFSTVHASYMGRMPLAENLERVAAREPVYKVQLIIDEHRQGEALARVQAALPQLTFAAGHGANHPDILFSSVVSPEACKHEAFAWLVARAGCQPAQVIAFGDGGSDKDFLSLAGVGVAMGNARADVQAVADLVTRSVEDDGVAHALRRLIPGEVT